jgi:replicative DNA helicase
MDVIKILPQAQDLEIAILANILTQENSINEVKAIIKTPEVFYNNNHKLIFEAVLNLNSKNNPIDILSVMQELRKMNNLDTIGGYDYILKITSQTPSYTGLSYHCQVVYEKFMKRKGITLCNIYSNEFFQEHSDPFDLTQQFIKELLLLNKFDVNKISTLQDGLKQVLAQIEINKQDYKQYSGMPTGLTFLDNLTGGLQKEDLIIIAGETSNGKTALATQMVLNACKNPNEKAVIYSLEMSQQKISARILASESGVGSWDMLNTKLDDEQTEKINVGVNYLHDVNIFFDESSSNSINTILTSIRNLKAKYDISLVMIDYLQLVTTDNKRLTKTEMVGENARAFKNIAKELKIPVILLSQLGRASEPKPTLNRLRQSGEIEEACDIALLVWQPERYKLESFDHNGKDIKSNGNAEIVFGKHRNGAMYDFVLHFDKNLTKFTNFDYNEPF